MKMLKFSPGKDNAKLRKLEQKTGKTVYTFSTLSGGQCCPYAKECQSTAIETPQGMRIQDGPDTKFRCFSASQEVLFPGVYRQRKHNLTVLLECNNDIEKLAYVINDSLPKADIIRVHVAGDMFTKNYFLAWMRVASFNPQKHFYAYTKSLPFWVYAKEHNLIPQNFVLTASKGGHADHLIYKHNLRYAQVVFSEYEARKLKLPIDHTDFHAYNPAAASKNFALLLHGGQPKGSLSAKAWEKLRRKKMSVSI